ncbi:thiamine phosphate synthase [bacterium]|nr:thiamine phosphate synthase [bacterium]
MNSNLLSPWNWNLYVITDEHLYKGRTHQEIAEAAIRGGAEVIQLRDKTASGKYLYETGQNIRHLTHRAEVIFIVNDRVDVALAVDADGAHVGAEDIPWKATRRLLPSSKLLGGSARNLAEALEAESGGADYVGVGPIYEARNTKPDAGIPKGLELLTRVKERLKIPIIAIGGINEANVAEVIAAGADAIAVISAIVTADDMVDATRRLHERILEAKAKRT